ncbi:adenine nucleotide alpha hydrolase [Agaricicola taiwanensis]|nr:adenine nucleotide alpha hydrolase [Agaricicola taiwanensis]
MENIWLSWSSGKDSAWALHELRSAGRRVTALVTTFRSANDCIPMHEVAMERVRLQAARTGLPLIEQPLPSPCPNEAYEAAIRGIVRRAVAAGATHMAFGDLFLEDIRAYREGLLAGSGLAPLFPLWGRDTGQLAHEMIRSGLDAEIVAVDDERLSRDPVGTRFDSTFLEALPDGIDPCGENGEFHTFVLNGPMFTSS